MNFNVYLPDDIGQQAKDQDLKLSRLLREAVVRELHRRSKLEDTLADPQVYEVELAFPGFQDMGGAESYIGLIRGKFVAEVPLGELYLTTDKRVIFVQNLEVGPYDKGYAVLEAGWSETDLLAFLREQTEDGFVSACEAFGVRPVVEL